MLTQTQDEEQIIARIAALDIGKAELVCCVRVPDEDRPGRIRCRMNWAGYPTLRLMALAETGTRGLLGATAGSVTDRDETVLATRLLHLLRPGMLVLLDRGFDAGWFFAEVASTGAMLLGRVA